MYYFGIYYLFKDEKKKFYISFILGYAGLILSHYIIAMYFSIFVLIILLFYIDKLLKNKRIIKLILGVLAVTILVLPNISIFLEHYNMDYLVSKEGYVSRLSLIEENILTIKDLTIPEEKYDWTVPHYIYIPVIIFTIMSLTLIIMKNKRFGFLCITLIGLCLLLMLCKQVWQILPKITYNIQFPWRILLILSALLSVISPIFLLKFNKKWIIALSVILSIIPSLFLINKLSNRTYHKDHTKIYLEKGTGNMNEYYPTAYYYKNKDYYENKKNIDVIEGTGNVVITKNDTEKFEFSVSDSEKLIIELPKIYYKGYKLTRNDEEVEIGQSKDYGLITVNAENRRL